MPKATGIILPSFHAAWRIRRSVWNERRFIGPADEYAMVYAAVRVPRAKAAQGGGLRPNGDCKIETPVLQASCTIWLSEPYLRRFAFLTRIRKRGSVLDGQHALRHSESEGPAKWRKQSSSPK